MTSSTAVRLGHCEVSDAGRPPRVGFVMERALGHVTHADNLRRLLPAIPSIEADLREIDFEVDGWSRHVPVFNSNWTVRAGLRARRAIRSLHRSGRLDVLFIHTQVPAVLSPDWMRRIPTVVSIDATPLQYDQLGAHYDHHAGDPRVERVKWRANRACFRSAVHLVTWSAWAKQGLVDGYDIDPEQISVIPPGVTPGVWAGRLERPTDSSCVRILFVGGDLERKGGDLLLSAFARLRDDLSATVGAPAVELHLVTGASVAPGPGIFTHRGLRPNSAALVECYQQADIFCLPTRADCLPMVLSEAGAAGLPLVSSTVGAIPEIVRDGGTGLLVPVDDEAALVAALRRLATDGALRQRLGSAARELVGEDFDAERNARRLADLLSGAAGAGARV